MRARSPEDAARHGVAPLVETAIRILLDADLSDGERSAERAKIQRLIARIAFTHLGNSKRAVRFIVATDHEISRRAREDGAQLPSPPTARPTCPSPSRSDVDELAPLCRNAARELAPEHGEDVQTRLADGLQDATHARIDLKPRSRLYSFQRILVQAAPPEGVAERFAVALARLLDVDIEEARAVKPDPRSLSAITEHAKVEIRREDHELLVHARPRHVAARSTRPRSRERHSPAATRAGPDDDDGPAPPARSKRPRRRHASSDPDLTKPTGRARRLRRRPR